MELLSALDRETLIRTTMDLIKLESHPGAEGYERDAANYIFNFLRENGIEAVYQEVSGERKNLIARLRGENSDKALMFTGHMDTVEDYGHRGLFNPKIIDGQIYGRGANDMKGAIAAMLSAAVAVEKSGLKPFGDIILAFVVDEEFKSLGTEALIKSGLRADAAILGEPSNMKICLGNKGLEWINVMVFGRATHGGTASLGINAVSKAAKLIITLEDELIPLVRNKNHRVLGNANMNIGCVTGGIQASSVPDKCLIKIDRRWLPGETSEGVYREIEDIIAKLKEVDKDFEAVVYRDETGINEMEHGPVFLEKEDKLVKQLSNSVIKITDKAAELDVFPGWTDASLLSNFGGIPTLIFGPGDIATAHSEKECVSIEDLYRSALIYGDMMLNFGRED